LGGKATYIDITTDKHKLAEMLELTGGKRQVPVIVEEGNVTIGYGGS
jgi:glutaredoxin 3